MTDQTQPSAPLPCPFCGSPGKTYPTPARKLIRVACVNDKCQIFPYEDFQTEADAIAAWNRRPAASEARREDDGEDIIGKAAWQLMTQTRREALEEAAKLCEVIGRDWQKAGVQLKTYAAEYLAKQIRSISADQAYAEAIRALAQPAQEE